MSKNSAKLTQSQVALRDRPPKTKQELDCYIRSYYGVFLAKTPIEEGNSSPLDFVWDIFSTAMGFNPKPIYNFLGMATRGGQKSLACGTAEMLLIQHDRFRDWFHMASIKEQSYVTYDYVRSIASRQIMNGVTDGEPTMRLTKSRFGRQLKIGTATMDSVNSFHGSVIQDEVDLTPGKIFNESKGMLSAQLGKMPLNVCISSRKFAFGNIQRLLNKAAKDPTFPYTIHKWGILEITAKCKPDRHGEYGTKIYVNDEDLIAISEDEYASMGGSIEQSKYVEKIGYKNCLKCGIFSFCQGRLPKQDDDNPYLQPIEVTKSQFKTEDTNFFKSQRLNRKPSTTGLIYPMWDESVHIKSYGDMWEIFHGTPHPDLVPDPVTGRPKRWDIERDELIRAFISKGGSLVVGVDFGFSILGVCGLYYIDGSDRIYFLDELSYTGYTDKEIAVELKKNWGHLPVDIVYADPESPGGKKEIRMETEWFVTDEVDKSVEDGIDSVRRFMRIPGTKQSMFFVAPVCTVFIEEVPNYRNKIDQRTDEVLPQVHKRNDHSCDQVRYVIHSRYGKTLWNLNFRGSSPTSEQFKPGQSNRAPTADEMARHLGVPFNDNRQEYENEKNKMKKDGSSKGSGGFSWSF